MQVRPQAPAQEAAPGGNAAQPTTPRRFSDLVASVVGRQTQAAPRDEASPAEHAGRASKASRSSESGRPVQVEPHERRVFLVLYALRADQRRRFEAGDAALEVVRGALEALADRRDEVRTAVLMVQPELSKQELDERLADLRSRFPAL